METIEAIRTYLTYMYWADIAIFGVLFFMLTRKGRPRDLTNEEWPNKLVIATAITIMLWPVFLILDLVLSLILRDWLAAGVDVAVLFYLWWVFGGRGKWKKWRKRLKEKVAVIKGRLKVIAVPSPVPA